MKEFKDAEGNEIPETVASAVENVEANAVENVIEQVADNVIDNVIDKVIDNRMVKELDCTTEEEEVLENFEDSSNIENSELTSVSTEEQRNEDLANLTKLNKEQIIEYIKHISKSVDPSQHKKHFEICRTSYLSILNREKELSLTALEAADGSTDKEELTKIISSYDKDFTHFKEICSRFRASLNSQFQNRIKDREANLVKKLAIIESLKGLDNSQEAPGKVYDKLKALQKEWSAVGEVPVANVHELWQSYHFANDKIFSLLRMVKELQGLDFKKNEEAKRNIIAKAQTLLTKEKSVINAFHLLQGLHNEWKEIGPVSNEFRQSLWEAFSLASSEINKRHSEHFAHLKKKNFSILEEKQQTLKALTELLEVIPTTSGEWNKFIQKQESLLQQWQNIPKIPLKMSDAVVKDFKQTLSKLNKIKKEHFASQRDSIKSSILAKISICERAEALALADSSSDNNALKEILNLQKEWKDTGFVPKKKGDALWERFRAACNLFFEKKDSTHKQNTANSSKQLKEKDIIISKLKEMLSNNCKDVTFDSYQALQKEWAGLNDSNFRDRNSRQNTTYTEISDKVYNLLREQNRETLDVFKARMIEAGKELDVSTLSFEQKMLTNEMQKISKEKANLETNLIFLSHGSKNNQNKKSKENPIITEYSSKVSAFEERLSDITLRLNILKTELIKINKSQQETQNEKNE